MKNTKQKKQPQPVVQRKHHDPAITAAHKAENIRKETERQAEIARRKNQEMHFTARQLRRMKEQQELQQQIERRTEMLLVEEEWLRDPAWRKWTYENAGYDSVRGHFIDQGLIKPKGGEQLLAALERAVRGE